MKKILKWLAGIICMAAFVILLVGTMYFIFTNPELTNTQILIELKYHYLGLIVSGILAVHVFEFFK